VTKAEFQVSDDIIFSLSGNNDLIFLDVFSDEENALQVSGIMAKLINAYLNKKDFEESIATAAKENDLSIEKTTDAFYEYMEQLASLNILKKI